jgi:hypothetical protein
MRIMLRFGAICPSKLRRNATSRYLAPAAAPRRGDDVAIELELELELVLIFGVFFF